MYVSVNEMDIGNTVITVLSQKFTDISFLNSTSRSNKDKDGS